MLRLLPLLIASRCVVVCALTSFSFLVFVVSYSCGDGVADEVRKDGANQREADDGGADIAGVAGFNEDEARGGRHGILFSCKKAPVRGLCG